MQVMQQQQNDAANRKPFATASVQAQEAPAVAATGFAKSPWSMAMLTSCTPVAAKEASTPSKAVAQVSTSDMLELLAKTHQYRCSLRQTVMI